MALWAVKARPDPSGPSGPRASGKGGSRAETGGTLGAISQGPPRPALPLPGFRPPSSPRPPHPILSYSLASDSTVSDKERQW